MSATLYLMVGLPCSGKTTKAKAIETELSALRLTPDEWHISLFGHDVDHPDHEKRHDTIEALLWTLAARALQLGTNVILDFGFWAVAERDKFRGWAKELGARSEIIFMDVEADELLRRLEVRNAQLDNHTAYIPESDLREWIGVFQPPQAEELLPRN